MKLMFYQLTNNKAVLVPCFSWLLAQSIKLTIDSIKSRKLDLKRMVGTGGMPSSHTAYVSSLAVCVGIIGGFDSLAFAVSLALAIIIMSDAAGIRRAAGNQASVLNRIISKDGEDKDHTLKEKLGHSPFEVTIGAILGIVLAIFFVSGKMKI